jgi:hypothetical protein
VHFLQELHSFQPVKPKNPTIRQRSDDDQRYRPPVSEALPGRWRATPDRS